MARSDEVLAAFLAAHGTRCVTRGGDLPLARLRRWFPTDAAFAKGIRLPSDWLSEATRLCVVAVARLGATPTFDMHGFAGTAGLALAVRRPNRWDLHAIRNAYPRRTDLRAADVIAFVEARGEREAIEESILWWNDHNWHWTSEPGWDAFARAAIDRDEAGLVDDVSIVLSNTKFGGELRSAWSKLLQERRNPDFAPIFAVERVGSCDEIAIFADRAAARARLASALEAIAAFAESEKLQWADFFRGARAKLDGGGVDDWVARDFEGSALDADGLALLAAAWSADAFGGMGSWNDVAANDQAGYARTSQALFESLHPAAEAAINGA